MMDEMTIDECFTLLKPLCNKVMKFPTLENITCLKDTLNRIPPSILQSMQMYLLFPFQLHLVNTEVRTVAKQHVIDFIQFMLTKTSVTDVQFIWHVYTCLFKQIFSISDTSVDVNAPEELKLSIMNCSAQLLRSSKAYVLKDIYKQENILRLSHGIYVSVQILTGEKMKALRLAAISNIMVHFYVDEFEYSDILFRHQVADTMVHVMPGVLDALCKTAGKSAVGGHQIKMMAVRAWSRIVSLIFEDRLMDESPPEETITWSISGDKNNKSTNYSTANNNFTNEKLKEIISQELSQDWIKSSVAFLKDHIKVLRVLQHDEHWKVRLELACACDLLLSNCSKNLGMVAQPLIECALIAAEDENEKVAEAGRSVLVHSSLLNECVGENFFQHSSCIHHIIRTAGESEQLTALKLMCGYLRLLGTNVQHTFTSAMHLKKVISALVNCSQLDSSHISILDDSYIPEVYTYQNPNQAKWKSFLYITSDDVSAKLEEVCLLIGEFGDIETLVYYILEQFCENLNHRKEITYVLNCVLSGGVYKSCSSNNSCRVVRTVLNTFFEPNIWILPCSVSKDVTLGQAQSNVVQCCLLVEGVGRVASAIGVKFKMFLLKSLYLVLEYAGSYHSVLAAAGREALQRIAQACGFEDNVGALICDNIDYLCFHISRKIKSMETHPYVLNVLKMVLKYSGPDILPRLQDIVTEVMDLRCSHYDMKLTSLLQILCAIVSCLGQWYSTSLTKGCAMTQLKVKDIFDKLTEYHKCRSHPVEEGTMEESEITPHEEEEEKEPAPLPPHVTLVSDIIQRCLHYLPSKNQTHQLLVLQTLSAGILILSNHTDKLLPCVHLVWSPLVGRFSPNSNPVVLRQSFSLLRILAMVAEDFIRSRTVREVMPNICQFLISSAVLSKKKVSSPAYLFTHTFKLQKEILSGLGSVVVNLKLPDREIDNVLSAVVHYLSNQQPQPLQNSCVCLLKEVACYDEDAVWFKLSAFRRTSHMQSASSTEEISEYESNVKLVINSISGD